MGINRDALYSIGKGFYREPEESPSFSTVTIRFRTLKEDVDSVSLVFMEEDSKLFMKIVSSDRYFDYYEIEIELQDKPFYYYFQIQKGTEYLSYNRLGVTDDLQLQYAFSIFPLLQCRRKEQCGGQRIHLPRKAGRGRGGLECKSGTL